MTIFSIVIRRGLQEEKLSSMIEAQVPRSCRIRAPNAGIEGVNLTVEIMCGLIGPGSVNSGG
jgi:hypothetical protein